MGRTFYTYLLIDPRDKKVRYVGCTTNTKVRYRTHLNVSPDSKNKRDKWIWELKQLDIKPAIEVVFTTTDITEAADSELKFYDLHNDGGLYCNTPRISRYPNRHYWMEKTNDIIEDQSDVVNANFTLDSMTLFNLKTMADLEGISNDEMLEIVIAGFANKYLKHIEKIYKVRKKLKLKDFPLNLTASEEDKAMFAKMKNK